MSKYKRVPRSDTKPEMAMRRILEELGVSFTSQHHIKTRFREWPFIVDFYITPSIVIEVDGVYWHTRKTRAKKDEIKRVCLEAEGYTVFRVTDKNLKEYPDEVKDRIKLILAVFEAKPNIPKEPSPS